MAEAWHEQLVGVAARARVEAEAAVRLGAYVTELLHWARRLNLTALDGGGIVERLIAPTLPFAATPAYTGVTSFADLGSGNGIPGVVLQLVAPRRRCILIEPRQRRAAFLRHLVRTVGVPHTEVVEVRAEALSLEEGARVELVVSRAVAAPVDLLLWCTGLLAEGGAVALWGAAAEVAGWQATPAPTATLYRRCFT